MSDRTAQFRAAYKELRILDQRNFYAARRAEYRDAHRQAVTVRNVLLVLAALAGLGGQLVTGTWRAGSGVLAAVLAALAGAVTAFEALIGFVQLEKVYDDAELALAQVEIDWDAGSGGDLAADLDRVEQIFHSEAGRWGQLVTEATPKTGR